MRIGDRVKETSTTTGTGTLNLAGASSGFHAFIDKYATGELVPYYISNQDVPSEFEYGIGTLTDGSPDTLARTHVIGGSNGTSAVNFSAGTKFVFSELPARLVSRRIRTVTGATTLDDSDWLINVNNSAAITITLPAAAGRAGKEYIVKKTASNGHVVTVDANASETIEGALTWLLITTGDQVRIVSDGTNWVIVGAIVEQARVTTTDATETTLWSKTIPADTTQLWNYWVTAVRTGGAAGTGGDYAQWFGSFAGRRVSTGTATMDGSTDAFTSSSGASLAFDATSNDIRARVTGILSNNYTFTGKFELKSSNRFTD